MPKFLSRAAMIPMISSEKAIKKYLAVLFPRKYDSTAAISTNKLIKTAIKLMPIKAKEYMGGGKNDIVKNTQSDIKNTIKIRWINGVS